MKNFPTPALPTGATAALIVELIELMVPYLRENIGPQWTVLIAILVGIAAMVRENARLDRMPNNDVLGAGVGSVPLPQSQAAPIWRDVAPSKWRRVWWGG